MVPERNDIILARTAIGREDAKILFISDFKHQVGKNDKGEIKTLAITPHRIYIITKAKAPKVDFSFHILEVHSLEGTKTMSPQLNDTFLFQLAINLQTGEKQAAHRFSFEMEEYVGTVVSFIIALLRTNFVNANVDTQVSWKLSSPEKQKAIEENINTLSKALAGEKKACGSFSLAYLCICDYYKQTSDHNAEVCWDIDKIYASHGCQDFKLEDFDLLDMKDLIPLIATLAYNTWFKRLEISSLKLTNELVDVIVKVLRRTLSIEEIVLEDCHLNKDHIQKISLALAANPNKIIKRVNFSKNNMEDKSVSNLCATFGTMENGLESIILSEVGMTTKGGTSVVNSLKQNKLIPTTLEVLNLSQNSLKLEGVQNLCDFLSQPNVLTDLLLSNTECPVDLLFTALHRGCQLSLKKLDLSGNPFFGKKSPKDANINNSLSSLQQFFSMSRALQSINLSNTKIPSNAVKAVLVGLLNNPVLTDVALDLSNNELKSHGAEELKSCLKDISLSTLNLSNNGLEQDLIPLCKAMQENHAIKELDLSSNINKAKNISAIADAISDILEAETPLSKLNVADNKLRVHAGLLFDALGTNETLVSLDIRDNAFGDERARMLAKALQINTKLQEILLDRNNITSKGLQDIAQAMDRNYSLHSLPLPGIDLGVAIKANSGQSFLKFYGLIEQAMIRNQSSKHSTPEQAFKVHQGLLMSSIDHYTRQVDEYVIHLEDIISKVKLSGNTQVQEKITAAVALIKEAELFRQVVLELYSDPEHSKDLLEDMFNKVTNDIVNSVECVVKDNIDKMLKSATNICPIALNKEGDLKVIKEELLKSNSLLEKSSISDSITHLGRNEITSKLCESNLLTAANIAEQLKKLFVNALMDSMDTLNTLYDKQVSEAVAASQQQNENVSGKLENIQIQNEDIAEDDAIPPVSTPSLNLLKDIVSENTFDLAWEFPKPRSLDRSALLSVNSEHSDDGGSLNPGKRRFTADSVHQGWKKKKGCSLKRRPTFYKENTDIVEADMDVDAPERTSSDASRKRTSEVMPPAKPEGIPEVHVNDAGHVPSQAHEQDNLTECSKSDDGEENQKYHSAVSSARSSVVLSSSDSMDDALDGADAFGAVDAFDDVSKQSVQLSVIKKVKPKGRRAPGRVSKLAHMKAVDVHALQNDDIESTPVSKPRPKSEMPAGNVIFDDGMRPRVGTSLKREPPARPSPPTPSSKQESPFRPDPPVTSPKGEAPTRPERPKKPELEKKPDPPKEKKVKPPTGAFQLPALPNLGGILKKRTAPKTPDTTDAIPNKTEDGGERPDHDNHLKDDTNLPAISDADSASSVDTPPTKPPPPVVKRSTSPLPPDTHSPEESKSPEPDSSVEHVTKPSPLKKPPRGIPMGGSALMAEMNKKLHIAPKNEDEEHSPVNSATTPAVVPPKPQKPTPPQPPHKPTPPQRPPSLKRTGTAERPNVPDRPKVLNKSSKSINEHENAIEGEKNDIEKEIVELSDHQSHEEHETTNHGESQDAASATV